MATPADELLLEVLKACEQSAPLYPAAFGAYSGLDRTLLDEALDHLRLRGLVRFTDWVAGKGQGYAVTPEGSMVLQSPGSLKKAMVPSPQPRTGPRMETDDSPWERGEAVRDVLMNPVRPVVCMTLLALNFLIFAIGMFLCWRQGVGVGDYLTSSANPQVNLIRDQLGSLVPIQVLLQNQWWRLLAYAFVHGGLMHIIMNMYFLFSLGPLLETMWGSVRFLVLYLVGALAGGAAVMLTMRPAVGASGALCGLLTSLGVWVYLNRRSLPPNIFSTWMRNVFTNILLIALISSLPGISWEGHLGGALGGALVSIPLNFQRFGKGWQKSLGLVGIILVPILSIGIVYFEYRDLLHVRWSLYPVFRDAEANAEITFNNQAVPILNDWENPIDEAHVTAAQAAFQGVQQELQGAIKVLDNAGPFREPVITETVHQGGVYLKCWLTFFDILEKTITAPQPWPNEARNDLIHQQREIFRARRPLEKSLLPPSDLR